MVPLTIQNPRFVALSTSPFNPASTFKLHLETPWCAVAPFVPGKPILFCRFELVETVRTDCLFERFTRQPKVHAVCVHLDELEIPPVDKVAQAVVIELQHSQFGQLINNNPNLKRPVDRHFLFSKLDLKHVVDLLHAIKPH